MRLQKPNPCNASNLADARSGLKESTLELGFWLPVILVVRMRDIPDTLIRLTPSYKRINCR
jgi:hypothetical protein